MAPPSPVVPARARRHRITTARASTSSSSRTHARPPSRAVMHSSSRTMAPRSASQKGGPRDGRGRRRRRPRVRSHTFIFSGKSVFLRRQTDRYTDKKRSHYGPYVHPTRTTSTSIHTPPILHAVSPREREKTPRIDASPRRTAAATGPGSSVETPAVDETHRAAVCDDGDVTDGWCVRARVSVDARAKDRLVRRLPRESSMRERTMKEDAGRRRERMNDRSRRWVMMWMMMRLFF